LGAAALDRICRAALVAACCFTLWIGMRLAVWAGCLAVAVVRERVSARIDGLAGDR